MERQDLQSQRKNLQKRPNPGHRLLILINILEINQYFSFSKNIDFCIDFAIDFGIDSETAKFDQI